MGGDSSRQRLISYLAVHGGCIESTDGRGLTKQLAEAVGYADLSGLNGLLNRLEREGIIAREVRGRRTFRIALAGMQRPPIADAPPKEKLESARSQLDLRHPNALLWCSMLLLLSDRASHGYDLADRLSALGFDLESSRIYRALHHLEKRGLVRGTWDTPDRGPARRVFQLTAAGEAALAECQGALRDQAAVIAGLLATGDRIVPGSPSVTSARTPWPPEG